jgi:hypothetical protein
MLQEFIFSLNNWWVFNALSRLPPAYQFSEIYGYMLDAPDSAAFTSSVGAGALGTRGGAAMPNSTTLAFKFSTNRRGRSYSGRNFWPLFVEGDVFNNTVSDFIADSIVSMYSQLIVLDPNSFPAGWTWVVNSRYNGNEARLVGFSEPITSVGTSDRIIDSQRRRLPGRGK